MSLATAISELFTAFGAHQRTDQAKLYVQELARSGACADCAEVAAVDLMRKAKRLPSLAELLAEIRDLVDSDAHSPHITAPQLAPKAETWWRHEAVKVILPAAGGDRDLAAFVAAAMWWSEVPQDLDAVAAEIAEPIWIDASKAYLQDKDAAKMAGRAFSRARWIAEHPSEPIPAHLVELSA